MADLDRLAVGISDDLRAIVATVGRLALGMAKLAAVVGTATFATGLWVFDGSRAAWELIGGALCFAPALAAFIAWLFVRQTVRLARDLVGEARILLDDSRGAAQVLIDYDSGERLTATAETYHTLRPTLRERRKQLPALYAGVRVITAVPALEAIAMLGTLAVGALGTVLLIGGLID
jgi:hypothetical protein